MVSSGASKLIIIIVVVTTFYGFFDYGIRGALEAVTQPDGVTEMQLERLNMTTPYTIYNNVTQGAGLVQFDVTDTDHYGATWHAAGGGYFTFDYLHILWDSISIHIPGDPPTQHYPSISEPLVISNWDSTNNYTRITIDARGGKEQDAYFFIRANATHYLYENITASLDAGEISMMIGGQLPRTETDLFSIIGTVATSFLTGISAPFTDSDYPAVLSLINYTIILLGGLAFALYVRG